MTKKRYSHDAIVIVDHLKKDLIYIDGKDELLELAEYVDRLQEEDEQLKKILGFLENDNAEDILNVLNSQENKIWEFKQENEQLKQEKDYFEKKKCEYWNKFNLAYLNNINLRNENEQLKQENQELENEIEKLENKLWNCQNVR